MVIAITGYKQSGKNTVSAYLQSRLNYKPYAFAWPIKEVCKIIFGWEEESFQGKAKETVDLFWGISPRNAMQWIGTEAFQYYLPNDFPHFKEMNGRTIWVKKFLKWMAEHPYSGFIITDVRFHHELDTLEEFLSNGVISLRVNNSRIDTSDTHASEQDIPDLNVDYEVDNSGDFSYLYSQLDEFIDFFRKKRMLGT